MRSIYIPYASKLLTNIGSGGRYHIIHVNTYISLNMFVPDKIITKPIIHMHRMIWRYRYYISYSYRMDEKHLYMYQNCLQILALRLWVTGRHRSIHINAYISTKMFIPGEIIVDHIVHIHRMKC